MKKLLSLVLAFMVVLSCATTAFANTTTLTTTVPAATYTLVIPADTTIVFNATDTKLSEMSVTDASGFAVGKDLKVWINYAPFTNTAGTCEIPYTLYSSYRNTSNSVSHSDVPTKNGYVVFKGKASGGVSNFFENMGGWNSTDNILTVEIASEDWGKALGGEYTSTITFVAEVVSAASE